ncbi:Increased DNA methylation 1 [Ananas comosus]|uniref:Increased DNA methylation 1 n=1 Tax=Ananas comosus TaxID=4615 RepID=A0A199VFP2_ANACO|nr:Increased DNA methylation 1 [Ananas comosus]
MSSPEGGSDWEAEEEKRHKASSNNPYRTLPAEENGSISTARKRRRKDWRACADDIAAGRRRVLRSDVAKLKAEVDAAKERALQEGCNRDNGNFDVSEWNGMDWVKFGEDVEVANMEILKPVVAKQKEVVEIIASRKNVVEAADVHALETGEEAESAKRRIVQEGDDRKGKDTGELPDGIHQDGDNRVHVERKLTVEIRCESSEIGIMSLDVAEHSEDVHAGGKEVADKFMEHEPKVEEGNSQLHIKREEEAESKKKVEHTEIDVKKVTEDPHADRKRRTEETASGAAITLRSILKHIKCDIKVKLNKEGGKKSDVSKQTIEPDTRGEDPKEVGAFRKNHKKHNSLANKRNDIHGSSSKEVKTEKRITRSAFAKQRENAEAANKNPIGTCDLDKTEITEDAVPIDKQKENVSTFCRSNGIHPVELPEEFNLEKKWVIEKDGVHERQKSYYNAGCLLGDETSGADHTSCVEIMEYDDNTVKKGIAKPNVVERQTNRVLVNGEEMQGSETDASEQHVRVSGHGRRRDGILDPEFSRKKIKTESCNGKVEQTEECSGKKLKYDTLKVEKTGVVTRSSQKNFKMAQYKETHDLDSEEEDIGSSRHKILKGHSRGGVHMALTSSKKVEGSEKACILRKDEGRRKYSGQKVGGQTMSNRLGLRKSNKVRGKSKSSSQKVERVTPSPSKQNNATSSRNLAKQKVRDEIKNMLLSAGWQIDMRPRHGRDYLDAVYIPPQGPGSYWSITKAYYVFLSQLRDAKNDKGKKSPSKIYRGSRRGSTFSPIPEELISMLKRNVVNKRRSKEKLAKIKKKSGGNGKKSKKKPNKKHPNVKNSKDDAEDSKGSNSIRGKCRKRKGGCTLLIRGFNQEAETGTDTYVPYVGKRTILSWILDMEIAPANSKVKYMDSKHTKVLLEGLITREGINCSCCDKVLTLSEFETHAGSELGQPYQNIFVEEVGLNLLQCMLNAWQKQDNSEHRGFYTISTDGEDPNDDTCGICGDGGDLICCDTCPSTFHMNCLGIQLFEGLQNLLGVKNDLEAGFSWRLLQRLDEDSTETISGIDQVAECNSKIAVALAVMDECFLPIIDQRSGINLIRNVIYNCGSNFVRLNFCGFYTIILEQGDEIISAASLRFHGTKLAEMPFIGTRNMYRRQGMCRRLLSGIESILSSLGVEKLVIPAISELIDTWTGVFGFRPLEGSQVEEIKSISMLVFPHTGLLEKQLLKKDSTGKCEPAEEGKDVESHLASKCLRVYMPDIAHGLLLFMILTIEYFELQGMI